MDGYNFRCVGKSSPYSSYIFDFQSFFRAKKKNKKNKLDGGGNNNFDEDVEIYQTEKLSFLTKD